MGKKEQIKRIEEEKLIRILSKDIRGGMNVYTGLTKIKGISWAFSGAICQKIGIDKNKKIQELSEKEIEKIKEFVKNPEFPKFMLNRRSDVYSGEDLHLIGADLDLQKEFDIKRLKKIKSYRGTRHTLGLPVRGQRTKSHFRKHRKKGGSLGVKSKNKK